MRPPSNRRAFPDRAHEDLATWVEEAIAGMDTGRADLADSFLLLDTLFTLSDNARTDIGISQADFGDSLLLVAVLFGLVDQSRADVVTAMNERNQLRADYDALTARVAALEAPPTPPA
jgi:hypothetical protein